jgi:hypothetical protein
VAQWTVHHNLARKVHNKDLLLARNLQAVLHNKHSLHHRQVRAQVKLAQPLALVRVDLMMVLR